MDLTIGAIIAVVIFYYLSKIFLNIFLPIKDDYIEDYDTDSDIDYEEKKEVVSINKKLEKELLYSILHRINYFLSAYDKKEFLEDGTWEKNREEFLTSKFTDAQVVYEVHSSPILDKIKREYSSEYAFNINYEIDDIEKMIDDNLVFLDSEFNPKRLEELKELKSIYGIKHYKKFIEYGYSNINDIVSVPPEEILKWNGIGKQKLIKILQEQQNAERLISKKVSK